ncbi:MAG TPA: sigma-54 dependent transcriptional regulator, partial [bacterium]|nr:sigma-54 dependent transcriptional regulator [bacterium]
RLLIVEDEPIMLDFMQTALGARPDTEVLVARRLQEGRDQLDQHECALIITDLKLPDGDGLDMLNAAKRQNPLTEVIIVTAYGTVETAVRAMRLGATDFIMKPFSADELETAVNKALEHRGLVLENRLLRREISRKYDFSNIIGGSRQLNRVFAMMNSVVASDVAVLITGESGTGKDLVARSIHFNSARASAPFMPINCAAIPAPLLESELFGHRRGSFTGAVADKLGLLTAADGGTVFLDEIGELPLALQAKLLRFLESKEVLPVGATRPLRANVRVIAATNRDLAAAVRDRLFREDLFYRLNVVPLHLPPLRERREDVRPLALHFLERHAREQQRPDRVLAPEALRRLETYAWPGNIRELDNVICRAVTLAGAAVITAADLALDDCAGGAESVPAGDAWTGETFPLEQHLAEIETQYVRAALRRANGVRAEAARLLQLKRTTLIARLRKLGLA